MATLTSSGAVPATPAQLNAELIQIATGLAPGLTTDLPGSLIEDMSSTATGALVVQDQAYVDAINSVSPYTASPYIMTQLGNVYGVAQGIGSNTSVLVTFTGTPGFVINIGFLVSDGTYQYIVQDVGIIGSGGTSAPVYCLASVSGSWAVAVNTVNQIITSVPYDIILTCTNATTGTPGAAQQTTQEYQAQVIQAGQAISTGMATLLKTAICNVSNVQKRLVSVRQYNGGWQVLCGGGDPYAMAGAIYATLFDINNLQPSSGAGGLTQTITIDDYPDTYNIVFVEPFQQNVAITVTCNTVSNANFVSPALVKAAAQPALATYINSIYVGQPISLLSLQSVFYESVSNILPLSSIFELLFAVYIDGVLVSPSTNSVLIQGSTEGFLYTNTSGSSITVNFN